jgi:hypothetical protein
MAQSLHPEVPKKLKAATFSTSGQYFKLFTPVNMPPAAYFSVILTE